MSGVCISHAVLLYKVKCMGWCLCVGVPVS